MANKLFHIGAVIILLLLLAILGDPFMLWMPQKAAMPLLLVAAVSVLVWAGLVMYERHEDEREALHKMHAGRIAYLSGILVLTFALLVQGISHTVDPWIPGALGVMVLSKFISRLYSDFHS